MSEMGRTARGTNGAKTTSLVKFKGVLSTPDNYKSPSYRCCARPVVASSNEP